MGSSSQSCLVATGTALCLGFIVLLYVCVYPQFVLAVDDIDNDKTDTFAPFVTPASPGPATSFLDEITFGGRFAGSHPLRN